MVFDQSNIDRRTSLLIPSLTLSHPRSLTPHPAPPPRRVAELEIVARDASSNPSARREGEPPAPDMLAVVTGESPAAAEAAKSDATGGPR